MSTEGKTAKMDARVWGLQPEQLAELPTIYRPDLFAGQRVVISGAGSGMGRAGQRFSCCFGLAQKS